MKTNRLICILGGMAIVMLLAGVGAPTAKADGFFIRGGYHGGHRVAYARSYYHAPYGYYAPYRHYAPYGYYSAPAVVYRPYCPPPRVVYYDRAPSFGFSFGFGHSHNYYRHHAPYYRPYHSRFGGHHRWR